MNQENKGWIVIAAKDTYTREIQKQLEEVGKIENKDFFIHTKFFERIFPIISIYAFGKLYIWKSEIGVTERCTLKCRKCVRGCGMVDINHKDMSLETVKISADYFFRNFDYVSEFCLIGGETLLYSQLPEAVEYIGSKYRNQIVIFSITSNGTIVPSERLVDIMRKYHVVYRISDYSRAIPKLISQHRKVVDVLKAGEIDFRFAYQDENTTWVDYGYDYVDRGNNEKELIKIFDQCLNGCHAVRKNQYFFCAGAEARSRNLGLHVGETDYFDLSSCDKMELFEFNMGYSEKGYLDMCNFCHGSNSWKYPVPVAEQIGKGEKNATES